MKEKNILGSLCTQEFSIKVGCETFGGGLSSNRLPLSFQYEVPGALMVKKLLQSDEQALSAEEDETVKHTNKSLYNIHSILVSHNQDQSFVIDCGRIQTKINKGKSDFLKGVRGLLTYISVLLFF